MFCSNAPRPSRLNWPSFRDERIEKYVNLLLKENLRNERGGKTVVICTQAQIRETFEDIKTIFFVCFCLFVDTYKMKI